MKVAVYAIAKDELRHVERFMASAREADVVIVLDTGSTDGTPERLAGLGAHVHHARFEPWRFDDARNAALALVPDDVDLCVALDLDEAFDPGWRQALEAAWQPGITRMRYPFVWRQHADGTPDLTFLADKIHARHGYGWRYPVHEEIAASGPERWATAPLRLVHRPAPHAHRGRYLAQIEQAAAELPDNHRFAYYLAREYGFNQRWPDVLAAGARYLAIPGAPWPVERAAVLGLMARAHQALGEGDLRLARLREACAAAPAEREPWVALAEACYEHGAWQEGLSAALNALEVVERPLHFLTESRAWGALPHDLASICAWQLGERGLARRQLREAVRLAPEDARLRANARAMGIDSESLAFDPRAADRPLAGALVVTREAGAPIEPTLASLREWCANVAVVAPLGGVAEPVAAGASLAELNAAVRRAAERLDCEWLVLAFAGERFAIAEGALDALAFATDGALAVPHADATRLSVRLVRCDRLAEVELAAGEVLARDTLTVRIAPTLSLLPAATTDASRHDLDELRARVRRQPDDVAGWYALARVAESLGEHQPAIDAWLRLLDAGDDELAAQAAYHAATLLHATGDAATALATLARGLARQPTFAALPWLAGWIEWQRGAPDRAAAWARMAAANAWREDASAPPPAPGRYLPGCYEGPSDVLRHALRALGDGAGAARAERCFQSAREARLAISRV